MLPIPLSLSGPPLGLWSDVLWRYPPAPPSPLADLKTQLPPQLPPDPRLWTREDVSVFLRFCEREFDLPKFELDLFQMNGKALCLLTRSDFGERCPGAGDVLHNVLQMLMRESQMMHRHLPSSPVTPTSRYPPSPHSHPPTPNWASLAPPESPFHNAHLHHFMQPNSVTLSPAPSIDSQASSPPQSQETNQNVFTQNNATSSSSNQSDSDEDSYSEAKPQLHGSPPSTPILKDLKPNLTQQITNVMNSWTQNHSQKNESSGGSISAPTTPAYMTVKREFFAESPETNTNGRLLWDFLQQLLNDPTQRYSNYIAWKCRDTGVFKIVDPPGLAKLWGIQKNHLSMNYDKMSRALRYYYRVNILRKVQGERHCYQFLRNPTELKNIKNISLLRQSVNNTSASTPSSTTNGTSASSTTSSSSISSTTGTGHVTAQTHQPSLHQQHLSSHHQTQQQQSHHQQQTQQQQQSQQQSSNHLIPPSSLAQSAVASSISSAYGGPPPTSPIIMHAINGAFHYMSAAAAASASVSSSQPPSSPGLQQSPCEKLPFNNLRIESNGVDSDDMKPTDLSVAGSERRFNASSSSNSSDCYPLIRNSDGLTTIKLIRYNENASPQSQQSQRHDASPQHPSQQQQNDVTMTTTSIKTESVDINVDDSMMPTDLRK